MTRLLIVKMIILHSTLWDIISPPTIDINTYTSSESVTVSYYYTIFTKLSFLHLLLFNESCFTSFVSGAVLVSYVHVPLLQDNKQTSNGVSYSLIKCKFRILTHKNSSEKAHHLPQQNQFL